MSALVRWGRARTGAPAFAVVRVLPSCTSRWWSSGIRASRWDSRTYAWVSGSPNCWRSTVRAGSGTRRRRCSRPSGRRPGDGAGHADVEGVDGDPSAERFDQAVGSGFLPVAGGFGVLLVFGRHAAVREVLGGRGEGDERAGGGRFSSPAARRAGGCRALSLRPVRMAGRGRWRVRRPRGLPAGRRGPRPVAELSADLLRSVQCTETLPTNPNALAHIPT